MEVTYEDNADLYANNYTGLTSAEIPEIVTYEGKTYSVTSISRSAFYGCSGLTSVTIPNSVTYIDGDAFANCENLTIYCEAESKPSGWNYDWNPDNRPVVRDIQA